MRPTLSTEPAALTTAITAAVIATINVLGIIFGWTEAVLGGLNIAAAAWVGVLGFWIRGKVTPVATMPPPEFP
ncbi:MAG TPA: hypothetical protein VMW08_08960 [Acidimicrobiales bacterium]|nr:hypothetical protein [Acidimicrobiales bacterium]